MLQDPTTHILTSDVNYKFQCGLCIESYHRERVRHLAVRSSEYISISPLVFFRILRISRFINYEQIVKGVRLICFNDSTSKLMRNAFYFILKALYCLLM